MRRVARYAVYLEVGKGELCMAHVLELPGCFVRAASPTQALEALPAAIGEAIAWLRQHGEAAPEINDPLLPEVAEEVSPIGPFDPGDAAALFQPERQPISLEEMQPIFRLMGHARDDLLRLVEDLPESVLNWQPDDGAFSLQRLLRHIGNAEEWYISRLLPPERLPPEWEHDDQLPILEFLSMERRTALELLSKLNEAERSGVFYPTHWAQHPGEAWTARKVMRRFLEHEREHTAQLRETLQQWKTQTSE